MLRAAVLAAAALLASSCTSDEVDPVLLDSILVHAKAAPGASFDGKTTYAWGGAITEIPGEDIKPYEPAPDVLESIQRLTNRELAARGYEETADAPSMIVRYGAGVNMTVMNVVDPEGLERMSRVDPGVKVGVCIAVYDAATNAPMWVGAATDDIDWAPTPEHTDQRLTYAIREMFKQFPE